MIVSFFVAGNPVAKGSAKAFVVKGRAIVTQDNGEKQKPWASIITYEAALRVSKYIESEPVSLTLDFVMPRPKGHYGSGKNEGRVKDNAPIYHTVKPDLDKLVRCVKDALTSVVWKDDSQVVIVKARKKYGIRPGVTITFSKIENINLI